LSCSLTYEYGKLVQALTRGDGTEGEDITRTVMTIKCIPHELKGKNVPASVDIRGEIYMTRSDFEALNKRQAEAGEKVFANPRNAAAGSVRQLDSNVTKTRPLRFFGYALGHLSDDIRFETYSQEVAAIEGWGFPQMPDVAVLRGVKEVMDWYHARGKQRFNLDFAIDGVVYKVNRI